VDQTTDLDTALGFVIGRIEEEATRSGGMGIQSSPFLKLKRKIPVYNVHAPSHGARHEYNSLLQ